MDEIRVPRKDIYEAVKRFTREGCSVLGWSPCDRDDPNFADYIVRVERRTEIRTGE